MYSTEFEILSGPGSGPGSHGYIKPRLETHRVKISEYLKKLRSGEKRWDDQIVDCLLMRLTHQVGD